MKVTKGVYDDHIDQILAILLKSQDPKDLYLCSLLFQEKKKAILLFPGWLNNGSVFSFKRYGERLLSVGFIDQVWVNDSSLFE